MNYKNICLVLLITTAPMLSAVSQEWAYGLSGGSILTGIIGGAIAGNKVGQRLTKTDEHKEKNKKWGTVIGGTIGCLIGAVCSYLIYLTTPAAQLSEIEKFVEQHPEDLSTDEEIKEYQTKAGRLKDKLSEMKETLTGETKKRAKEAYQKLRNVHTRARAQRKS